jgi:hypothetical protein
VLEDESWPVFLAWCRAQGISPEIRAWLEAGPDLETLRDEYLRHSPNPLIRALADSPSSLRSLTTAAQDPRRRERSPSA